MSYGDLGASLDTPVSGVIAGKWMASCPIGHPWWRVVGKDGRLLTARRDPRLAAEQRGLLESEGVVFLDDAVKSDYFVLA